MHEYGNVLLIMAGVMNVLGVSRILLPSLWPLPPDGKWARRDFVCWLPNAH